jgi:hypothetical protein
MSNVNKSQVLNPSEVSEIMLRATVLQQSQSTIARQFDIGRATVYDIINRRTWKSVAEPKEIRKGLYRLADDRIFSTRSNEFLKVSKDKSKNRNYVEVTVNGKREKVYV